MSKRKCKYCGSENVKVDAWAIWDKDQDCYIIDTVFDDEYCPECENQGNNLSVNIDE